MSVTCALFGPYRKTAGRKNVELEVTTPTSLRTVLDELANTVPDLADDLEMIDENGSIAITVDGKHINHLDGLATVIEDDSIVRITPPIRGGAVT